jgi:hypothetical protein
MPERETIVNDFEDEIQTFIAEIQGGGITGICRSESNDAIALELKNGVIIEFRADGSLVIASPKGGEGLVLQLRNEEQRLIEMAFWGFAG